jgi:hypothetical protein
MLTRTKPKLPRNLQTAAAEMVFREEKMRMAGTASL